MDREPLSNKTVLHIITAPPNTTQANAAGRLPAVYVFAFLWAALFLIYLPAANAGWVSDTLGWLDAIRSQSFSDYVMRKGFSVPSFYQLTQVVTWAFYQAFSDNRWAWHLLQLSLHALNATLLFTLLRGILSDSGIARAQSLAFGAAALFCTTPYVSEVIVWEAAFHFLQGMLLILLQLHLLRRLLHKSPKSTAIISVTLYAVSLFSLELFYLVPPLCVGLCIYYRTALHWEKPALKKTLRCIVWPQVVLVILYFIGLRVFVGASTGRLGNEWLKLPITSYLVKPPEYFFHLFGGRFLPAHWRHTFYKVCSSYIGSGIFYAALTAIVLYGVIRFRRMAVRGKIASFLAFWLLISLAILTPLWFPQRLLIVGDRYLYALLPPFFALLVIAGAYVLRNNLAQQIAFTFLIVLQCGLTLRLNLIWNRSNELTTQLVQSLTDDTDKITILLNNPASLQGALMIGSGSDGEARLMHNLFYQQSIEGRMYDAPALNLLHPTDTARYEWLDAQTLKVSRTQPGAFWQYGSDVAHSFSTADFSIAVDDPDCCYILRLARPAADYRLIYQHIGKWKTLLPPN